jgi:ribosomal-protein-alanine N-acetyltransferase
MNLVSVGAAEAAALSDVHALSFDAPWSAPDLAALLGSPGVFALGARDGAAIHGFILARAIAGEAEILTLAVDPNHRREGLGRALLVAAEGAARTAGAEALFLEVAADNPAAVALYQTAGLEVVGRRHGYYARAGRAVDALVLRKNLRAAAS